MSAKASTNWFVWWVTAIKFAVRVQIPTIKAGRSVPKSDLTVEHQNELLRRYRTVSHRPNGAVRAIHSRMTGLCDYGASDNRKSNEPDPSDSPPKGAYLESAAKGRPRFLLRK